MQKHYIIGDVHGEYQTLLALVAKLPKDTKFIFVGDLIDRGLQSREIRVDEGTVKYSVSKPNLYQ